MQHAHILQEIYVDLFTAVGSYIKLRSGQNLYKSYSKHIILRWFADSSILLQPC